MMKENTWRNQYIEELANEIEDYKATKNFMEWLMDEEHSWRYKTFERECKKVDTEEDFYYICVEFCIPAILLKKILKERE